MDRKTLTIFYNKLKEQLSKFHHIHREAGRIQDADPEYCLCLGDPETSFELKSVWDAEDALEYGRKNGCESEIMLKLEHNIRFLAASKVLKEVERAVDSTYRDMFKVCPTAASLKRDVQLNDYVEGTETIGYDRRQQRVKGWVKEIFENSYYLKADDCYEGNRGTTIAKEGVVILEPKPEIETVWEKNHRGENKMIRCPKCGGTRLQQGQSYQTLVCYLPRYENGVNTNPDRNKHTTTYICERCGERFEITGTKE